MKHVNVGLFVPHNGCPHRCSFCNQRTISGRSGQVTPGDVDAAVKTALNNPDCAGGEIAFFGGSFTAIDRETMVSLLSAAAVYVKKGLFKGIRCSTRPDAVDEEICEILGYYGVTSVELGAQSLDDTVLKKNNRGHTAADVERASGLLKANGFELGLQMMTGLYGSGDEDSIRTARGIIALKPDTVRIYPTIVLEGTELCEKLRSGEYKPQSLEEAVSLCAKILPEFYENGIKVIRVGLHSGGGVEDGYAAGPYHPAFRELCESRIYLEKALDYIDKNNIRKGNVEIFVHPGAVSQMTGQKRKNIESLAALGYYARVLPCEENTGKYKLFIRNEII